MRKSNLKIQLKILDLKKRINRIGATELKLRSKELQIQICLKPNFKIVKTLLKLIKQKEGLEMKILPLVS